MLRFVFIFAVVPSLAKTVALSEGGESICRDPDSLKKYPNSAQPNTYFQCVNGNPIRKWCPSRQNFNADKEICEPIQDIDKYPDVDRSKIKCSSEGQHICNPLNKHSFYLCSHDVPYLHDCPAGLVFNRKYNVCDHSGPPCGSAVTEPLTPEQRCANGETVWAHPDECALFYNCSVVYSSVPRYFEQHMNECPYPQLFNEETLRCEDFQAVTCGARNEPKAGCDYLRNKCPCRPCYMDYPSCINARDGPYFDSNRLWTPIYVVCKEERAMSMKQCLPLNNISQIFSPDLLVCVSVYDVPREFNGLRPDCTGKKAGLYPEENGRCDIYFQCFEEEYAGYRQCSSGMHFDPVNQVCKLPKEFYPPCGTRQTDSDLFEKN